MTPGCRAPPQLRPKGGIQTPRVILDSTRLIYLPMASKFDIEGDSANSHTRQRTECVALDGSDH